MVPDADRMEGGVMRQVGLIGCGGIAAVHAAGIREIDGSRLAAVADCVPKKAQSMAAQYGAECYTDWRMMLQQEKLDVVHICTPHYLHTPMIEECLKQGVHVFSEKPPVISWEDMKQLKRTVREMELTKLRLCVCFQNRWNPEVQFVRKLLHSGELGPVIGARGIVTWNRDAAYYESEWRGRLEYEGGGALINQGIHTLDLLQYLIGGKADKVEAIQGNLHLQGKIEVEDTLSAYIRYPRATALLYVTTGYIKDLSPIVEIQCEGGAVRLEHGEVHVSREEKEQEAYHFSKVEGLGKACWGAQHEEAIRQFYKSIDEGTPNLLDFQNVEDSLQLMLQIYESARQS